MAGAVERPRLATHPGEVYYGREIAFVHAPLGVHIMPDVQSIPPSSLLLDPENPRLSQPNEGQRETMRALVKAMPRKIVSLAKDIVTVGLNPADLPIVMPANDAQGRYVVLEGNRRIVALKVLESPDTFVGVLDAGSLATMRSLSREYQTNPVDSIVCLVVGDRSESEHWISLRHTGENQGVGIVPWGADDTARFRARRGTKGLDTQALDFLERRGAITAQERASVPVTSFRRLLGTPEFRGKVGLGLSGGKLQILGAETKVAKALKHVALDLADGKTTVKDIYEAKQRRAYANTLPSSIVVPQTRAKGKAIAAGEDAEPKKSKRTARPAPQARRNLIPHDCTLTIRHPRIRAIEQELRSLPIGTYANAVATLKRVFIELSVDEYIDNHQINPGPHAKLREKLSAVVDDLVTRRKLTSQQAKPVRRAMAKDSYLAPSVDLMHDYIHNQNVFPAAGDLRAYWDSLQPFMMAMWSA